MATRTKKEPELKPEEIETSQDIADQINDLLKKDVAQIANEEYFIVKRITSGSLTLDRILGGGFALGRHVELVGDSNSGKSYIMYRTIALSQQRGKKCALIDPERTFDSEWFEHLGGSPKDLIIVQPDIAEDAIEVMTLLLQRKDVEVIGVDSVAALLTREEREKEIGKDVRLASQARFMSTNLKRVTSLNYNNTLVLWTNQYRTGGIGGGGMTRNVTPGGKSLLYYDTTRLEIKKGEAIKSKIKKAKQQKLVDQEGITGYWTYAKSIKEKSTIPGREGSFIFNTIEGRIDEYSEIVQLGLEDKLIERSGNTFTYIDLSEKEYSGGYRKFLNFLKNEPALKEELVCRIKENTAIQSKIGNLSNVEEPEENE